MKLAILCLGISLCAIPAHSQAAPPAANTRSLADASAKRAEVLVLGTYHMANPGHDVFNVQVDDVLAPARQKQIAELIEVLKKFKPTKIAIEADFDSDVVPKRYADYLAGKHELTRNEIEQIGFRLAKEMGHKTVYPADADGDFLWQRVQNYAKATGQTAVIDQVANGGWGVRVKEENEYLKSHTVLEALRQLNSDETVTRDVGYYFTLAHLGEPGDYAGPDLLTEWYRRNIKIFNNVTKLITAPDERVLVIFGSGHLGWLRQDFANDPSIRLRKLEEFVEPPQKR